MTYWKKRQKQLLEQLEKDEKKLKKRMSKYYEKEAKNLEKQIASFYSMYGKDNVIEYRNLTQKLSSSEQRLLMEQMDEFANKYPQYSHLMDTRANIYKLNRLEGLQTSIQVQMKEIGAKSIEELEEHLKKQASNGASSIADMMGFGKNFYGINSDLVKNVVKTTWANGANFSSRIWGNTDKLANYLNQDVAQAFARGDSYDKIARNMTGRFGKVARSDMNRLIYTEGTFVMAESSMKPLEDDFEKYKISTVGDGRVCDICKQVSEKEFDVKDRQAGTNFPPFHAWCRCTFEIVVDDWDQWMDDYEKKHGNKQSEKIVNSVDSDIAKLDDLLTRNYKELDLDEYKKLKHSITKEERKIIYGKSHLSGYLNSSNARKINEILRKEGYDSLSPEYKNISDTLQNIINKNTIKDDIMVTRYVEADALENIAGVKLEFGSHMAGGKFWEQLESLPSKVKKQREYIEKGFLSTSGISEKNVMTRKQVKLNIKVPKGKNCYVSTNYKESEIIFGRNTKMIIENMRIEGSRTGNYKIVIDFIMK